MYSSEEDRYQQLLEAIRSRKLASQADDQRRDETERDLLQNIEANRTIEEEKKRKVADLEKQLRSALDEYWKAGQLGQEVTEELAKLRQEREAAKKSNDKWVSGMLSLTVCLNQHIWKPDC